MTVPEDWLSSGLPAVIGGRTMALKAHGEELGGGPIEIVRGQARAYYVDAADTSGDRWVLKKFLPGKEPERLYVESIAALVPHGFDMRAGWQRLVLAGASVEDGPRAFAGAAFRDWIEGTVLMPLVRGPLWADMISGMAEGAGVEAGERAAVAVGLARSVEALERAEVSHRDLSGGNLIVTELGASIIDWDAMWHPSLEYQAATRVGTDGYTAPWATDDARRSWARRADRFALAVCIAEILGVVEGDALHHDGSLFRQEDLGRRCPAREQALGRLHSWHPDLADMFRGAWDASDFDGCPAPVEWAGVLDRARPAGRVSARARIMHAMRDGDVDEALALRAVLDGQGGSQLDPGTRRALDEWADALGALRRAARDGDDAAVVAIASSPALGGSTLHPADALVVEGSRRRARAADALAAAVSAGDPSQTEVALARCVTEGCRLPDALADAAWRIIQAPAAPTLGAAGELEPGPGSRVAARAAGSAAVRDGAVAAPAASRAAARATARAAAIAAPAASGGLARDITDLESWPASATDEQVASTWMALRAIDPDGAGTRLAEAGMAARLRWGHELRAGSAERDR
ncbi:MAG: hypothetical protein WCH74_11245 [Chloroflexota bacterium]